LVDVHAKVPGTGKLVTDYQSPKHHFMTGVAVAPEDDAYDGQIIWP
jgi:hypothetical protein